MAIRQITDRIGHFEFDLITARMDRSLPRTEKIGNVNIYRLGIGVPFFDKYYLALLGHRLANKLQKERNYKAIWSMMASYNGFAALSFKKQNPNIPFLLSLQEGDDFGYIEKRVGIFGNRFREIFLSADYIQAISKYLADWARIKGATCPVEVIGNGVDVEKFLSKSKEPGIRQKAREELLKKFNFNEDDRIVITTSRLVKKNDCSSLIKAMAFLPLSNYKLFIIGQGEEAALLKKIVCDLNLTERVVFAGQVDYKLIPDYLVACDIFCRPSLSEGLGNSFLEAMAAGLPTIGTAVGGIPDFLSDNETGWICERENPKSIAEKIDYILDQNNKNQIDKVAENGRRLVTEKYEWNNIATQMREIFLDLKSKTFSSKKSLQILIATGIFPPDIGGPAAMIKPLAEALIKRGFGVKVLTYAREKSSADGRLKVFRVYFNYGKIIAKLIYFLKLLYLSFQSDLVYVTDTYSVGYFAYVLKKYFKRPYVLRFAGDGAWEASVNLGLTTDYILDFLDKTYGKRIEDLKKRRTSVMVNADQVIAVSNFLGRVAVKIGVPEKKVNVIYNSIDFLNQSEAVPAEANTIRLKYGETTKIIVTVCRLTPWKGVDGVIRILPKLKQEFGDLKFLVLGDGQELVNLKKIAADLRVSDQVEFLGRVPHRQTVEIMSSVDLLVLNTNYEGLSHVLLEAMSVGVPIVASNAGGNPELISQNENGILVNYNNLDELFEGVKTILGNKELADRFVASSKEKLKKFNWEKNIEATEVVIRKICF